MTAPDFHPLAPSAAETDAALKVLAFQQHLADCRDRNGGALPVCRSDADRADRRAAFIGAFRILVIKSGVAPADVPAGSPYDFQADFQRIKRRITCTECAAEAAMLTTGLQPVPQRGLGGVAQTGAVAGKSGGYDLTADFLRARSRLAHSEQAA